MTAIELKKLLREAGISQASLARRLGIQPSTVSNWMTDNTVPTYAAAYLALLLEVRRVTANLANLLK